jgi:excisionase family DNA binding protein
MLKYKSRNCVKKKGMEGKITKRWMTVKDIQEYLGNLSRSYVYDIIRFYPKLRYHKFLGSKTYFKKEDIDVMIYSIPKLLIKRMQEVKDPIKLLLQLQSNAQKNKRLQMLRFKFFDDVRDIYRIADIVPTDNQNNDDEPEKRFLSVEELCSYLQISKAKIYQLTGKNPQITVHRLKGTKMYFDREEIDRIIEKNGYYVREHAHYE